MESKLSSVFVSLVFALVFIVGGWLFYKNISQTIVDEANASVEWPTVQGILSFSNIETSISDGDEMYRVDLLYAYTVQGENYTGNRISTIDGSTSSISEVERKLNKYPEGELVNVYYDPNNHHVSLLETGADFFTYAMSYGPLLFSFIGVLLFLQSVKKIGLMLFVLFAGHRN